PHCILTDAQRYRHSLAGTQPVLATQHRAARAVTAGRHAVVEHTEHALAQPESIERVEQDATVPTGAVHDDGRGLLAHAPHRPSGAPAYLGMVACPDDATPLPENARARVRPRILRSRPT